MLPQEKREAFRAILSGREVIRPGSVYDPISARIAEDVGFELGLLGGSAASLTILGDPDLLLITLSELAEQVRRAYNPLIRQMRNIEKPVIAAVNGIAAGTGLGLALACDIRYASERARFVEVSVRIGLLPGSGTGYFLPRLIGLTKAMEMAFNGDELDAVAAEKYGLVSRVIAPDNLLDETRKLAVRLAKGPTRAIGLTKQMMYRSATMGLEQALDFEAHLVDEAVRSQDYKEGLRAFNERRPPEYKGY